MISADPDVVFELGEADGPVVLAGDEDAGVPRHGHLPGLLVIVAGVLVREVLLVPGEPQVAGEVVGDLLDGEPVGGRRLASWRM